MSNHIDRSPMELWERSIAPGGAAENNPTNELEINVIFTDHQGTLGALKTAGALAHQLRAHINLLVPRVVPYAFPLASYLCPAISLPRPEAMPLGGTKTAISRGGRRQGTVVANEGNQTGKDASVCWAPGYFRWSRVRNDGPLTLPFRTAGRKVMISARWQVRMLVEKIGISEIRGNSGDCVY